MTARKHAAAHGREQNHVCFADPQPKPSDSSTHQGPKWRRGFGVATQDAGSDIPVLRHRSELKLQGLNPKDGLSCDSCSVRGIYYPDTAQTERS